MNHRVLTEAAESDLLKGVFVDIETGVVAASDGIIGAAWKPSGTFIEANVCIRNERVRSTLVTLVKLHDAETIGEMEIDLAVLMRALESLMVNGSKDAPIRQATLLIKQPKPNTRALEIVERTMTSDAGTTLLLMGVSRSSTTASSALDYLPRWSKPDSAACGQNEEATAEVQP